MSFFDSMEILADGLSAERVRMDVTTSNMANAQTTRTAEGGPYRRRDPVFVAQLQSDDPFAGELAAALQTVAVQEIVTDTDGPRHVHSPGHPDADARGDVAMPNVVLMEEMVNMITASRSYEAQVTCMHGLVEMTEKALNLGR